MKDSIKQFTLVIIAVLALSSLMGFAHPAEDTPKQYMVVYAGGFRGQLLEKLEADVNQKIQEGWKPQGGIIMNANGFFYQAMVK